VKEESHVNLAQVARRAGVSIASASRALRGRPGVSHTTRARVTLAAEELSYVVSPEASRLAGGASTRVAVVVPHLSRWFFGALLEGLESVLRDAEVDVLLYHVGDAEDRRDFFGLLPARRKVDALVLLGLPVDDEERRRLELMGVQITAVGGQVASYPYVRIDDYAAGRQAVDHLLFLGHQRIAMIAGTDPDQPGWPVAVGRSEAYHEALREAGLPTHDELVVTVDWGGAMGAQAMGRLLSLREPPTAVYAHSDELAAGALRTLRRAGLDVPGDISVVGIDDHPVCELMDLTTVRQPVREQGVAAGETLLRRLRGEPSDDAVTLPTQLVVRGSTGRPRRFAASAGALT
jgi:DNA-binding LacI/PurR family transcriptional regulator